MTTFRFTSLLVCTAVILCGGAADSADAPAQPWRELEPGLALVEIPATQKSESGDSIIRILRIDPERFSLRLLNASADPDGKLLTARQWSEQYDLVAAINTSMYQTDYRTSVSLMKTKTHVNNPHLSKDKTILAFDPLKPGIPMVKIIDRECDDLNVQMKWYGSLVQSIRMISCRGRNVWKQQPEKWSTAAVGMDDRGNVLFIHVRSPYSTHDLINMLLGLPVPIRRAMYTEGGPEAQLFIRSGGKQHEFVGSRETGYREVSDTSRARPIPNAIGVMRRNH